ncbi:MAG: PAS domain S-box protein [Geobacter sp.]|nr:MAG: PAS domain S-box protein [Geobacter sp.]
MQSKTKGCLFKKYGLFSIAVWTVVIVTLAATAVTGDRKQMLQRAEDEARDYFRLNLQYRAWAARMGGVYVSVGKAAPNPYLTVARRDVATTDGMRLTLVNPAYLTRMVFATVPSPRQAPHLSPVTSRITSLKPVNPVNVPDPWERESLLAFERGESRERSQVATIAGAPYLRFISAFVTETSCLTCHRAPGDREGVVRGALVISVPLVARLEQQAASDRNTVGRYFLLWVLGTAGIAMSSLRRFEDTRRLTANEQRFRTVCDWTQDWEYWVGPDGAIRYMSPSCIELTGYAREEFQEEPELLYRVVHHDFRESLKALHQGIPDPSRPARTLEVPILTRGGELRWIQHLCRPIFEEGVFLGLRASNRDITRQRQDTEKIRLSESRLVTLLGILQYPSETVQGFLDNALEEAIRLTGSRIGFIGHYDEERGEFTLNCWSRDVMRECALPEREIVSALEQTGLWGEVVRQRRAVVVNDYAAQSALKKGYPQGHAHLSRFMSIPVFSGDRIVAVVGMANKEGEYDDTDVLQLTLLMESVWKSVANKRAEQDLLESNERFAAAFNNAPLMLAVSSLEDGVYLEVNQRFLDAVQWSRDEVIGKRSVDLGLVTQTQRDQVKERMLRDGRIKDLELTLYASTGRPVLCRMWTETIAVAGEKRLLTIILDITEQRRVEQQFLQAQKMESVGQLAGGVAHDFNNMLSVILGHAELGLMDEELAEGQRRHLEAILDAANRSSSITRQLLTFARRQNVLPRVIEVNEAVAGMLKMLGRLIGEEIELLWVPGERVGRVNIDPSQVDQLLANLCVNARDAIAGVGRINISTQNATLSDNPLDAASGLAPGRYVLLSVSDTGQGMSGAVLDRIFEPFYTTKEPGKGTGLGLATVFGIVKQNGGGIKVQSTPGEGTTFRIYLPSVPDEEGRSRGEAEVSYQKGDESILVVEDELWVREMVSDMLVKLGYRVTVASTPEEALAAVSRLERAPELLITDVIMPGMNGSDLALRLGAANPGVKTLFMSGYASDFIARHGVINEGVHFLPKPFTLPTLAAKVREVLDGAG